MKRLNKQLVLKNDWVNLIYGSTNRCNPQVLYITCKWWCKSKTAKNEKFFETFIGSLKKKFNSLLRETEGFDINSLFIPIDYLNSVEGGEKKYLYFEAFLMQSQDDIKPVADAKCKVEKFLNPLISYLVDEMGRNGITVMKNKRE